MNLADLAGINPKVAAVLDSDLLTNSEKAKEVFAISGFSTTESSVRRYLRNKQVPKAERKPTPVTPPKGWEPYAEEAGKIGSALVRLPKPKATERELLVQAGFDPDCWRISGAINTRRWMRYDQEWLYYYKFDVEQGESPESRDAHVEDLVKMIRQRSNGSKFFYGGKATYVLVISDWQIGKSEGGKGSADTVRRWNDCLAQAREDIIRLRKSGVDISRLLIISVGDLVEGCGDHYDMQTFLVDLDRRSQNRVVRELITKTLLTLVPMFDHTTVACIGGNHGENRRKGKAYTTFADNDDVATIEAVREAFDLAGWNNITWVIPGEELSLNVEASGVNIGLVHGHQFRGGANTWKKAEDWWRSNDFGLHAVQKSQILVSGHFHFNADANISGKRSWFQAPTIDPGSKWYTDISGVDAIPGQLTFVVSDEFPLGYDYRRILHPRDTEQVV